MCLWDIKLCPINPGIVSLIVAHYYWIWYVCYCSQVGNALLKFSQCNWHELTRTVLCLSEILQDWPMSQWNITGLTYVSVKYYKTVLCLSEILQDCPMSQWNITGLSYVLVRYYKTVLCLSEILQDCSMSQWNITGLSYVSLKYYRTVLCLSEILQDSPTS